MFPVCLPGTTGFAFTVIKKLHALAGWSNGRQLTLVTTADCNVIPYKGTSDLTHTHTLYIIKTKIWAVFSTYALCCNFTILLSYITVFNE